MKYELEKSLWTDADFKKMGWHDCKIYKIRLREDLEMDIDYIFQWNKPDIQGLPYTFWVAPSTLIFKKPLNLSFDIDTWFDKPIEIEDIEKKKTKNGLLWTIITHQGDFEFLSNGYEQFIRQEPFFQFVQTIPFKERNGISLDRITNQENTFRFSEEMVQEDRKNLENYEMAKLRQIKRLERDELFRLRELGEIDLKEYLKKKEAILEMIYHYDFFLNGTLFENW